MTLADAVVYLDARIRRVCDLLGNRQKPAWSGQDYEAVRALLEAVRAGREK